MSSKKKKYTLSIIVPMYDEPQEVVKTLLDSIEIQQNVDLNEIEVVIVKDGGEPVLTDEFIKSYSFDIKYLIKDHAGVSAARNFGLDHCSGTYCQFADCDDMFYNACGLWIVFREIKENKGFDSLVSAFIEETRINGKAEYITHDMDSTFVHGKIHRRKYLLDNNIRWNDKLTIHEDSYFNCLCQNLSKNVKFSQTPFYLWRWRDNSVCRHDDKYILKTFNNMLDSNTALVNEFLRRNKKDQAMFYATSMIYDSYFTLNKDEWINQENQEYRKNVELRFKQYYNDFKYLFDDINSDIKKQIIMGIKNRMYGEGLFMEKITFDDWISHILEI